MSDDLSKIIAYDNGDILDVEKCKKALMAYWELNKAETRAFDRLFQRTDLKEKYLKSIDATP